MSAAPAVFLWLGTPWRGWRKDEAAVKPSRLMTAAGIFFLGLALEVTFLMALGWTLTVRAWLGEKVSAQKTGELRRLSGFLLLAS